MDHPLLDTFFTSHGQASPPSELDLLLLNAILALPPYTAASSAETREPRPARNTTDACIPEPLLACSLWALASFCHNHNIGESMVDTIRAARRRRTNRVHQALSRLRRGRRRGSGDAENSSTDNQQGSPPIIPVTAPSTAPNLKRGQRGAPVDDHQQRAPDIVEYLELLRAFGHHAVHA